MCSESRLLWQLVQLFKLHQQGCPSLGRLQSDHVSDAEPDGTIRSASFLPPVATCFELFSDESCLDAVRRELNRVGVQTGGTLLLDCNQIVSLYGP